MTAVGTVLKWWQSEQLEPSILFSFFFFWLRENTAAAAGTMSVHSAKNHLEPPRPPNYSVIFIFTVHKTFFFPLFFRQFAQNHPSKREIMCCGTESSAQAEKWAKSVRSFKFMPFSFFCPMNNKKRSICCQSGQFLTLLFRFKDWIRSAYLLRSE